MLALLSACRDGGEATPDAGSAHDAEEHEPEPEQDASTVAADASNLSWLQSEVALEPDGRSVPLTFSGLAQERPVFALRTYAADAETSRALCFQLEDVRADEHVVWVPEATSVDYGDYCTRCAQRVAVGAGYGLFVLPSAAALPAMLRSVGLRIALRDCLTLAPLSPGAARPGTLLVESLSFPAPTRERTLGLPLAIAEATPHTFTAGARLDEVFARVHDIWLAAGVELTLRGPFSLPRPTAPLSYGANDRASLSALERVARNTAAIDASTPLVVLTPCLLHDDPLGVGTTQPLAVTAHMPGGFAPHDEPDAIFVAGERCGGLTPGPRYVESETLGAIIAHELGHYLGLFHVRESDGREDALADTSSDMPNLMQAMPNANATALAESQIEIARRHPALAVEHAE
jgi:hypothetical protein